ncbi:ATPase SWSAP1 [Aulostomus maculatus]
MVDILAHTFRAFMPLADPERSPGGRPPPPTTCSSPLVLGEINISRSVLLLAAVTAASEMGMKVVFFAQNQIQSLPPSLQKYLPNLSPQTLKKIKFCYPRTVEELLVQVASLHESSNTSPTPPSLIIVDRLQGFLRTPGGGGQSEFHLGEQSCAAHLSALLFDTAAFLTHVLEQQAPGLGPCRIIASYKSEVDIGEPSAIDPILSVLERYFEVRCTLDEDRGYGAAASGLQEMWHIYLSGTGITHATSTKDPGDGPGVAQEWQVWIFADGLLEFKTL